ncbi:DUF177 domain-containing protein [soil metagenome]
MLSYNVAALLRSAPGTERRYEVALEYMPSAEDVRLAAPIAGEVRLSRTGRSILARAELSTALEAACARCLRPLVAPIDISIDEEALPSIDIDSGQAVDQAAEPETLRLDEHHELDLGESIREAISLAEPITLLCRPDCPGLCLVCGLDLNSAARHEHSGEDIDPRLALLAEWREPPDSN